MALYRGSTKLAGIGAGFVPENSGTTGQVLTKTSTGYNYQDIPQEIPTTGNVGDVLTKTANGVAFQTIETGAPNHLEESALVGEKYALTDTLFKQLTPALDDCTVEANVGYDAATTEIHIQRQGSGTASNTLKLKLKKAGSPANLVVEVRKGVQVDVSTSEAYWYGDSEQVLATGSIDASDVTTSWQELEVELDAAVGGTEGELLDIVLYQTASAVSSTNYYVMACDSTQWSEGFSYVKVNGNTRSREKTMPYCISDGFAQALLVKDSNSTEEIVLETIIGSPEGKKSTTISTANTYEVQRTWGPYTYTGVTRAAKMNVTLYPYNGYGCGIGLNDSSNVSGMKWSDWTGTFYGDIPSGNSIKLLAMAGDTGRRPSYQINKLEIIINMSKGATIPGKPRELKSISNKAAITIFGIHIDNSWIEQS